MRIDYNSSDTKKAISNKMKGFIFSKHSDQPAAAYIGNTLFTVNGKTRLTVSYTEVPNYIKVPFSIPLENK